MATEYNVAPNYGTLAAIVQSKSGPYYFKLSAPAEFIVECENDFLLFLKSYRKVM